jgi:hypothetical protein
MGRWAQRQIRGGGPGLELGTQIVRVVHVSPLVVDSYWNGVVDPAKFGASDMSDTDTGANSGARSQPLNSPTVIRYSSFAPQNIGDNWEWNGVVAGIPTPQSGIIE